MDGAIVTESHVPGLEGSKAVAALAGPLVNEVRASGKPTGVIWLEYTTTNGVTQAQVHFIPEADADNIREDNRDLLKGP